MLPTRVLESNRSAGALNRRRIPFHCKAFVRILYKFVQGESKTQNNKHH